MNKLLTFEGGQPFTTQDVAFLQDNFNSAITNLINSLCSGLDCILTGIINGSGNRSNVSALPGSLFIKGNIYVLTKDIPKSSETSYYLCIRQIEQEKRIFRDSSEHNVYLVDDAYMSETPTEISLDLRSAKKLEDILLNGEGKFENLNVEFSNGVSGSVLAIKDGQTYMGYEMIATIIKSSISGENNNRLWTYNRAGRAAVLSGVAIDNNKLYIVVVGSVDCRIFNIDGSEYNGAIAFYDVKMR